MVLLGARLNAGFYLHGLLLQSVSCPTQLMNQRQSPTLNGVLGNTVARCGVEFLCGEDFSSLRKCETSAGEYVCVHPGVIESAGRFFAVVAAVSWVVLTGAAADLTAVRSQCELVRIDLA